MKSLKRAVERSSRSAMIVAALGVAQVGALCIDASLGHAQEASDEDDLSAPRGLYLGVKPGETNYAPGKRLEPKGDLQRVIWVGFQARRDRAGSSGRRSDKRAMKEVKEVLQRWLLLLAQLLLVLSELIDKCGMCR